MRNKRKKIWIDRFQTYMSLRMAGYFLIYQISIWLLVVIELQLADLRGTIGEAPARFGFAFIAVTAVSLGLMFVFDAVRWSHRIAGPVYRVRKSLQAITAGEELSLVKFRKGDCLQDLKDDLNDMLVALEKRGALVLKSSNCTTERRHSLQPAAGVALEGKLVNR